MPRKFAQIHLSINIDEDFNNLDAEEQALWFRLTAWPKLLHCGVADWHPGRVAEKVGGWDAAKVRTIAARLHDKRYVLIDESTDEFLIRSYIRSDDCIKSVKSGKAVIQSVIEVASPWLRDVILHELARLKQERPGLGVWSDESNMPVLCRLPDASGMPPQAPPLTVSYTPSDGVSATPSTTPPDSPSDAPREALADGECDTNSPFTIHLEPGTNKRSSSLAARATDYPSDFEVIWKLWPRPEGKGVALKAWRKACKARGNDKILEAVQAYLAGPLPEKQFIPHFATWLNQGRYDDPIGKVVDIQRPTARSTTDERVARGAALRDKYLAIERGEAWA